MLLLLMTLSLLLLSLLSLALLFLWLLLFLLLLLLLLLSLLLLSLLLLLLLLLLLVLSFLVVAVCGCGGRLGVLFSHGFVSKRLLRVRLQQHAVVRAAVQREVREYMTTAQRDRSVKGTTLL